MKVASIILSCLLLVPVPGAAQTAAPTDSLPVAPSGTDSTSAKEGINAARLALVGGLTAATMVGIHVYQSNGWWKDNRASFHFQEDLQYGLWVDKLGHFYGATAGAFILRKSFEWTNMSPVQSLWFGSAGAVLFQTFVEVQDGFSAWGFDRVDFAANVAGALYPVAQFYWPPLKDFNMKFSYHPSDLIDQPGGVGFKGQKHILFDDYEGQTLWLSVYVNNLLPSSVEPVWPDWLALAVGYGVRDVATPDPYSIVMLSLDYDLTKIIPQDTAFLRLLSETLNFIHWPAPAVRISPNAVWYGLYF